MKLLYGVSFFAVFAIITANAVGPVQGTPLKEKIKKQLAPSSEPVAIEPVTRDAIGDEIADTISQHYQGFLYQPESVRPSMIEAADTFNRQPEHIRQAIEKIVKKNHPNAPLADLPALRLFYLKEQESQATTVPAPVHRRLRQPQYD